LKSFERFTSVNGTAEETTLATQSVDLITAGQAFHWFHPANAREEFLRILKPNGCVVIIWNERRLGSTPFLQEYEQLLLTFGTDYQEVRHENVAERVADFFAPNEVQVTQFDNEQLFDLEGLRGRLMSASYTPEPDHPNFQPMMTALQHLFQRHELNGRVAIEYDTTVRYGRLSAVQPQ
jgi:SAM-dependent methyltransferase